MTMAETVFGALMEESRHGASQTLIAERHNFPVSAMRRLLIGETKVEDVSLGRIQLMFPHATINLYGGQGNTATATSGIAVGSNTGSITQGAEDFKSRAISALIDSDIEPDALKSALKIINNL